MSLAIKHPPVSTSAVGWLVCAATDRMDKSLMGGGSFPGGAKVGLEESSRRHGASWARWEKSTGPCHLLWPPVSFLCSDKELALVRV